MFYVYTPRAQERGERKRMEEEEEEEGEKGKGMKRRKIDTDENPRQDSVHGASLGVSFKVSVK